MSPLEHPEVIWLCVPLMLASCCLTARRDQLRAALRHLDPPPRPGDRGERDCLCAGHRRVAGVARRGDEAHSRHRTSYDRQPVLRSRRVQRESCGTYQRSAYGLPNCFGPAMMWTVVYAAGAGMLYLAVLASFNRCLGRMAENRFVVSPRGGARRFRRSKSSTALSRLPEHVLPPLVIEVPAEDEQQV